MHGGRRGLIAVCRRILVGPGRKRLGSDVWSQEINRLTTFRENGPLMLASDYV
jgi:hypothetical protein